MGEAVDNGEALGETVGWFAVTAVDEELQRADVCIRPQDHPHTERWETAPWSQFRPTGLPILPGDTGDVREVVAPGSNEDEATNTTIFVLDTSPSRGLFSPEARDFARKVGDKVVSGFSDDEH